MDENIKLAMEEVSAIERTMTEVQEDFVVATRKLMYLLAEHDLRNKYNVDSDSQIPVDRVVI